MGIENPADWASWGLSHLSFWTIAYGRMEQAGFGWMLLSGPSTWIGTKHIMWRRKWDLSSCYSPACWSNYSHQSLLHPHLESLRGWCISSIAVKKRNHMQNNWFFDCFRTKSISQGAHFMKELELWKKRWLWCVWSFASIWLRTEFHATLLQPASSNHTCQTSLAYVVHTRTGTTLWRLIGSYC